MNILVFQNKKEEINKIKYKNIIYQICGESIIMDIIDYNKLIISECKNGHNIENILLDKFENTQKKYRVKIKCELSKNNNKSN